MNKLARPLLIVIGLTVIVACAALVYRYGALTPMVNHKQWQPNLKTAQLSLKVVSYFSPQVTSMQPLPVTTSEAAGSVAASPQPSSQVSASVGISEQTNAQASVSSIQPESPSSQVGQSSVMPGTSNSASKGLNNSLKPIESELNL